RVIRSIFHFYGGPVRLITTRFNRLPALVSQVCYSHMLTSAPLKQLVFSRSPKHQLTGSYLRSMTVGDATMIMTTSWGSPMFLYAWLIHLPLLSQARSFFSAAASVHWVCLAGAGNGG